MTLRIPFMSLVPGPDAGAVRDAIDRVIARGWFILGPELAAFEAEFAKASGSAHAVGVGVATGRRHIELEVRPDQRRHRRGLLDGWEVCGRVDDLDATVLNALREVAQRTHRRRLIRDARHREDGAGDLRESIPYVVVG